MPFKKLTLKDKGLFNKFLNLTQHELSVYAFENIYIWKSLFDIYWQIIADNLCIFFKDNLGCFLYLAPQGKRVAPQAIKESFRLMDTINKNKEVSRIENVEEGNIHFYRDLGYVCQAKFGEYICRRGDLAWLKGNSFKSKRAACNYFIKHYKFQVLPFSFKCRNDCLQLYEQWMRIRQAKRQGLLYEGMLEDSRRCLAVLLDDYRSLNFTGRTVRINKELKAFSFGFKLNKDTFCILYEIADLSVKGLAQYIFREFCRQLNGYKYINIMDDSGLANLREVKLSYRPTRLAPAYIVKRKYA